MQFHLFCLLFAYLELLFFSSSFDFYLASYYSCSCRTEKCRKHVKVLLEEGGAQGKAVWFGGKKVI